MNSKGFTLIELTMVIVIMCVIAVSLIGKSASVSSSSVDALSRKVQSNIRYAQQLAKNTGVKHGAVFKAGYGYEVYRSNPGNQVADPVTRKKLIVKLADFDGVSIEKEGQIEFNPSGSPASATDTRIRFRSESGSVRDICVIANTGAVMINFSNCRS